MPPGASLTYLATDMWTQEARTCRQCKPKAQCHLVHSFSSPSSVRSHLFLSLSFSSILSFSAKYPTNKPSNLPWAEQGQQEHQCSTAVVQESKRAPVGGPCAREKLGKSTMVEHVLLQRLKVDDFFFYPSCVVPLGIREGEENMGFEWMF